MRGVCAALVMLAGCGRIGFDGPDGGAAPDDGAIAACGALFCDGFERPNLEGWNRDGSVVREAAVVHHGSGALQATSTAMQPASVNVWPLGGRTTGSLYLRAWFYAPGSLQARHIELLGLDGSAGASDGVVLLVDNRELRAYSALGKPVTVTSGVALPAGRWVCLGLRVEIAATDGEIEISLDDAVIGGASDVTTLPAGGYARVSAGLLYLADPGDATIYIDDVVVDTEPVGCS